MLKKLKKIITVLCVLILAVPSFLFAAENTERPLTIGYCEGESYYEFDYALNYFILGLQEYGLIGALTQDLPIHTKSAVTWQFLQTQDQSGWKVRFEPTAYFSLTDAQVAEEMNRSILEKKVDLMLSLGTTAGQTTKDLNCKTICLAAADAVGSGIVASDKTSGTANVWAMVDTDVFRRSITVMDDVFAPKTVGVVYADNEKAYIYSGARDLDTFAKERGITVKKWFVDDPPTASPQDMQTYYSTLKEAFTALSGEVDVYIMTTSLIDPADMTDLFAPFYAHNVPIYSINTTDDVEAGALMAAESSDYQNIGRFAADTLRKHLAGAKLEELPQIYQTAPFLVINYNTARKIGYRPTFDILLSASKLFVS